MTNSRRIEHLAADERGQTLTEYSLLVVLIAVVVAVAVPGISTTLDGVFRAVGSAL
jgi:Flp pilus assembly pilin Flp